MSLVFTKVARKAIRGTGHVYGFMWTNKYEDCRTVKMYCSPELYSELAPIVDAALKAAGSTTHSIKQHVYNRRWYGYVTHSLIVRIPND